MKKHGKPTFKILFIAALIALVLFSACSNGDNVGSESKFTDSGGNTHIVKNLELNDTARQAAHDSKINLEHKSLDNITFYSTAPKAESEKLIILIHSSDSEKEEFLAQMGRYSEDGYYCVAFDIRGFGERKLSETKMFVELTIDTVEDVDLLLDYFEKTYNIKKFGLEGYSVGGSVIYQYCADGKRTPAAIAVGSSTPDLGDQAVYALQNGEHCEPIWTQEEFKEFAQKYNPLNKIQKFNKTALLVGHSTEDPVVSVAGDRKLEKYLYKQKNNNSTFYFFEGKSHSVPDKFVSKILPFFNRHVK